MDWDLSQALVNEGLLSKLRWVFQHLYYHPDPKRSHTAGTLTTTPMRHIPMDLWREDCTIWPQRNVCACEGVFRKRCKSAIPAGFKSSDMCGDITRTTKQVYSLSQNSHVVDLER